jgi:magnesium chelatase accessory protein
MNTRLHWKTDGAHWPHRDASRFMKSDGVIWHVQHWRRAAPVVVLIHGTGASTHSWRDLVPLLLPHCELVVMDLPGHAFTSMPVDGPSSAVFSLDGMAKAMGALFASLGIAPTLVVGHSAGAAIAVRMCLDRIIAPDLLLSINGALTPLEGLSGRVFSPLAKLLTLAPLVPELFAWRAGAPAVLGRLIDGTGSRLNVQGTALYRQLVTNPGHAAGALGMMANWDLPALWRDLPGLATTLNLVVGANDLIVPPHTAARVASALTSQPRPVVHSLPGLGHLAHEEAPELVARHIVSVLTQNRSEPCKESPT